MCLSAIYWAHIRRVYYGNTRKDAADIDFADDFIYQELEKMVHDRSIPLIPLLREEALDSFQLWNQKTDKVEY